jgi:hypothetical protein
MPFAVSADTRRGSDLLCGELHFGFLKHRSLHLAHVPNLPMQEPRTSREQDLQTKLQTGQTVPVLFYPKPL